MVSGDFQSVYNQRLSLGAQPTLNEENKPGFKGPSSDRLNTLLAQNPSPTLPKCNSVHWPSVLQHKATTQHPNKLFHLACALLQPMEGGKISIKAQLFSRRLQTQG